MLVRVWRRQLAKSSIPTLGDGDAGHRAHYTGRQDPHRDVETFSVSLFARQFSALALVPSAGVCSCTRLFDPIEPPRFMFSWFF